VPVKTSTSVLRQASTLICRVASTPLTSGIATSSTHYVGLELLRHRHGLRAPSRVPADFPAHSDSDQGRMRGARSRGRLRSDTYFLFISLGEPASGCSAWWMVCSSASAPYGLFRMLSTPHRFQLRQLGLFSEPVLGARSDLWCHCAQRRGPGRPRP